MSTDRKRSSEFLIRPQRNGNLCMTRWKALLMIIIILGFSLAGIYWQAPRSAAFLVEDAPDHTTRDLYRGDFVVTFMDDPSPSLLAHFDIKVRGFQADSTQRFSQRGVNTNEEGRQFDPDIAADSEGNFVVVWADDTNLNGLWEIYARGFDSNGSERFPVMTVNSDSAGDQRRPAIAMAPNGDFVVAWQDDKDGNGMYQILARGFDSDGQERIPDFTVNTIAAGQQIGPDVAILNFGGFVIVWEDDGDMDDIYDVRGRGFLAHGAELFPDMRMYPGDKGDQKRPAIAAGPAGTFVVTWEDDGDGNGVYQIHARGFEYVGSPRIPTFPVNSEGAGQQRSPKIASDETGDFVIIWEDDQDNNGTYQILARGFNGDGSERIADFTVNSVASGQQLVGDIGMDGRGNFVVTWMDDQDNNDVFQIMARGFYEDGSERFADFTVNSVATGQQIGPAIAVIRAGRAKNDVFMPMVQG